MERGQEDRKLEANIELLEALLESAEFKKLRIDSERHLVQRKKSDSLLQCKEGKHSHQMTVTDK